MTVPESGDSSIAAAPAAAVIPPLEPPLQAIISADNIGPRRVQLDILEPTTSGRLDQDEATLADIEASAAREMSLLTRVMIGTATMLCYFVSSASFTAVVMVVPSIAKDFGISNLEAQWVTSSYGLSYGWQIYLMNTLLVAGRIADIYGRRTLFVGGMGFYTLCSIVSPFIPNWIALCVIRAFAGLGLAVASPAAFGITAVYFPENPSRTVAFSALALGNPLGAMVGTLIGGSIASGGRHSWSYLYLVFAAVSAFPIAIGVTSLPEKWWTVGRREPIDWIGATIITGAITLFAFSLTQSGVVVYGWKTPYIPALFTLSILLFGLFAAYENHLEQYPDSRISRRVPPVVKMSLFTRQRGRISAITFGSFAIFTCVPGWIYLTSIYYQDYQGLSALDNALRLVPSCVSGMLAAVLVIYLLPRARAAYIMSGGAFLSGISCLIFAVEPSGTSYWKYELLGCFLISFGADMGVVVGSIMVSNLVKDEEQSVAGAIFQTSVQIASAFGICLSSLVANEQAKKTGDVLQGLRDAFGMNVGWALIVPIVVMFALRGIGVAQDSARPERSRGRD